VSRNDKVREYVEQTRVRLGDAFVGVDAADVAAALSIWRSDASAELNRLCELGFLVKRGKKPVRYLLDDAAEASCPDTVQAEVPPKLTKAEQGSCEAFSSLIGHSGSLRAQVKMAKAAVLYPPLGLHTLIIGQTGVGKSLFAEEMWKYSMQADAFGRGASTPYIVFNCAEYSDNPQLLLSQLFGHVRGAFTGADAAKPGLVELAEGGILFLDEIHRLPPTGQEMFFMLLDRGCYRMLGDTRDRRSRIMIVGATSEDPSSTLLATFKRRMPVTIQIPSLTERPLYERLSLVNLFLSQEANRLGCQISISGDVLRVLMSYRPKANIGDLRNDLQLCCAHSYLSYRTGVSMGPRGGGLRIGIYDLPQKVYLAAPAADTVSEGFAAQREIAGGVTARPGEAPAVAPHNDTPESIDLYNFVERQHNSYLEGNVTQDEIDRRSSGDLERYWIEASRILNPSERSDESIFWDIVAPGIWKLAEEILDEASSALKRDYSTSIRRALSLHLQQFIERVKSGQIIYNPNIKYIRSVYPREIAFLEGCADRISDKLGVAITEDELCFLSLFLKGRTREMLTRRVGLVIAAHGKTVASSMADLVNRILCVDKVRAVDAPLEKGREDVLADICAVVSEADEGRGVLVLADMGSFVSMRGEIVARTGIQCRVLQNVSSSLALEAARIVLSSDLSLREAYEKLVDCASYYSCVPDSGAASAEESRAASGKPIVLVVCATGIGSAEKIKEIIAERVPGISSMSVMTAGLLDDIPRIVRELRPDLRLIIGTIDPEIPGVTFISASAILSHKGLAFLDRTLAVPAAEDPSPEGPSGEPADDDAVLEAFALNIGRFASSLPGDQALARTQYAVERLEAEVCKRRLTYDERIRAYMHIASLFDRLSQGYIAEAPTPSEEAGPGDEEASSSVREIMAEACRPFGFAFPESEAYYVLASMLGKPRVRS
jgi:transcriptional regulator with AAA-type ATPase domain/transcriptional regulatory protein LevR